MAVSGSTVQCGTVFTTALVWSVCTGVVMCCEWGWQCWLLVVPTHPCAVPFVGGSGAAAPRLFPLIRRHFFHPPPITMRHDHDTHRCVSSALHSRAGCHGPICVVLLASASETPTNRAAAAGQSPIAVHPPASPLLTLGAPSESRLVFKTRIHTRTRLQTHPPASSHGTQEQPDVNRKSEPQPQQAESLSFPAAASSRSRSRRQERSQTVSTTMTFV